MCTWENWDSRASTISQNVGIMDQKKSPSSSPVTSSEPAGWSLFNWISCCVVSISWLMHIAGVVYVLHNVLNTERS